MSKIKNKDTLIELRIRKFLYENNISYRLHDKRFEGRPDIYIPRYKIIVFINGCFWHGHSCGACKIPSSNIPFWTDKLRKNVQRDKNNLRSLKSKKIKVLTIWGCALSSKSKIDEKRFAHLMNKALNSKKLSLQMVGNSKRLKGSKQKVLKELL